MNVYTATKTCAGLALLCVVALAGCSSPQNDVSFDDAWIKATDSEMSGMFGTVTNTGSVDVTVVGATVSVAATVEIHEVANGVMREKSGGFVVPSGSVALLQPGADHLMVMGLTQELKAGESVRVEVELSDGSRIIVDALVKNFQGANEEYAPGHQGTDMN